MHALYFIFRVVLELIVILALADFLFASINAVNRMMDQGRRRVALFFTIFNIVSTTAVILRLYVFGPRI